MKKDPLEIIPGVGPRVARDLRLLGFKKPSSLKGKDPERMYAKLCALTGVKHDRCLLYVFRAAVYYASQSTHDPELLKWWNWSDENLRKSTER